MLFIKVMTYLGLKREILAEIYDRIENQKLYIECYPENPKKIFVRIVQLSTKNEIRQENLYEGKEAKKAYRTFLNSINYL